MNRKINNRKKKIISSKKRKNGRNEDGIPPKRVLDAETIEKPTEQFYQLETSRNIHAVTKKSFAEIVKRFPQRSINLIVVNIFANSENGNRKVKSKNSADPIEGFHAYG